MNRPTLPPRLTLLWIARETWSHARASRLSILMLAASALAIALCLSIHVEKPGADNSLSAVELTDAQGNPISHSGGGLGRLSLAFGAIKLGILRDANAQAQFFRALMARWAAGAIGVLLALIATAGLVPEALRPDSAVLVLTKPVARATVLWGKALGVIAFVTAHATLFVVGTWAALGLRLGNWDPAYLLSLPILCVHFVAVFAVAVLIAVCTRSAVACTLGAVAFWCICLAANQAYLGRALTAAANADTLTTARPMLWATKASYWILPKPLDLLITLDKAVDSAAHFVLAPEAAAASFNIALSFATSLLFAAAVLVLAGREFATIDY